MQEQPSLSKSVVGKRLRQVRLLRVLSQEQLGAMAGLEESSSSARMSRYESGIHEPPAHLLHRLSEVLKVSAAFFYCADDRLAKIILLYARAPEEGREILLQQAKAVALDQVKELKNK